VVGVLAVTVFVALSERLGNSGFEGEDCFGLVEVGFVHCGGDGVSRHQLGRERWQGSGHFTV
jgi:hypothetical protein